MTSNKEMVYEAPRLEVLKLSKSLNLLNSLSLEGSLDNWEVNDDVIDFEDGY